MPNRAFPNRQHRPQGNGYPARNGERPASPKQVSYLLGLATQQGLDRDVELRVLNYFVDERDDMVARFRHEFKTIAALDHPNICTIHEIDETPDGQLFIVMAYYQAETLKEKLAEGPLPVDETICFSSISMFGSRAMSEGRAPIGAQTFTSTPISERSPVISSTSSR